MMKKSQSYMEYERSRFYDYFGQLCELIKKFEGEGIPFYFFQTPVADRISGLSGFERERINNWTFDFNNITPNDIEKIKKIYGDKITTEYLQALYDGAKVIEKNGVKCLNDFSSEYVNIISGQRITTDIPAKFYNKIHVFGQCTTRGTGVEDKDTIPSMLQAYINHEWKESYAVINHAVGCGSDLYDDMEHMKEIIYTSGDLVILCSNLEIVPEEEFRKNTIRYYDCSSLFNRPHNYGEWFTDMTFHTNGIGNKVIAEYIFEQLKQNGSLKAEGKIKKEVFLGKCIEKKAEIELPELREYIDGIKRFAPPQCEKTGAIVMNCNPFTLGHQYLIETASKMVDNLFVFVVEEDKSFFAFQDRINLVKKGTEYLSNVQVIPSGKFIISAATFPGYFYKDEDNTAIVDTSKDINLFCCYIAPALNIKVRFVGEEPIDYITLQYNQTMKEILPKHGIALYEIKRKEACGKAISASMVRRLLEVKDWKRIRELVPDSTFDFLQRRFG